MLEELRAEVRKHRRLLVGGAALTAANVVLNYLGSYSFLRSNVAQSREMAASGVLGGSRPRLEDSGLSVAQAPSTALALTSAGVGMAVVIAVVIGVVVREFDWRTIGTVVTRRGRQRHAAVVLTFSCLAVGLLLVTALVVAVPSAQVATSVAIRRLGVAPPIGLSWAGPDGLATWVGRPVAATVLVLGVTVLVSIVLGLVLRSTLAAFLSTVALLLLPTELAGQAAMLRHVWLPSLAQARIQDAWFVIPPDGALATSSAVAGTVPQAVAVLVGYSALAALLMVALWRRLELR